MNRLKNEMMEFDELRLNERSGGICYISISFKFVYSQISVEILFILG